MKPYTIGVDIGTTSTKAVIFNEHMQVIYRSSYEYPLYTETPDAAEQDPDEIFHAVLQTIRTCVNEAKVDSAQIRFVSFSSAMHSLLIVDEYGNPLTRSITWADNRSEAWAHTIKSDHKGHDIYSRTGTPIHPMSPLVKMKWLQEEHTHLFQQAYKFISIKEYVFFRLFGIYAVDYSIASATGLFNLKNMDWDHEVLSLLHISRSQLSEIVSTTESFTGMKKDYAQTMCLQQDTPFVIGASDGVLSNLGVDAIDPGVVALTIGTSGAIRTVIDRPITDPEGRFFCYALTENHWVIGGAVNNGGMIYQWVRNELANLEVDAEELSEQDPYETLSSIAANSAPGSAGLIFHPYLSGERAPLWNGNARGSFIGLGLHHKKEHMIRSVLEGITMNLYTVLLSLEEQIGKPTRIHATGGFTRSSLWVQILADVFQMEVRIPDSYESSCLGAVVLGMYGRGEIDSLNAVKGMIGTTNHYHANLQASKAYEELLPIFIRIPQILANEYDVLASFQRKYTLGK
ncbi:gluconokinase [Cytobacillus sp. IB215665]|uniref:gluconokinase n=1 Tax=Cytobacillus sp. IB215665 TaxID=3097357 RepID=UPI002A16BD02|nr:gluconokinase [Cytobacillus sp. IB215665]MDX8366834.1 gluconokinase [Cytobacillus sp. IB215665]